MEVTIGQGHDVAWITKSPPLDFQLSSGKKDGWSRLRCLNLLSPKNTIITITLSFWSGWHKLSTLDKSYKRGKFGCLSRKTLLCLSCGGNSFKWRKFCRNTPSRSAEGGEFNGRFKNDRLTIEMDSGIKFSFNFNKKYCSMFGYQLTIIVLTVWAISVKITRWISFTVKEVDRSTSSKRGECPCFTDERCFAF